MSQVAKNEIACILLDTNNKRMIKEYKQNLIDLGLSEKESKVYLVLLNEGSGTADNIAKHAGLNRSTTYVQIESLSKSGLVSTYKVGKKTYFSAESPNNLQRLIEKKERNLELQKAEVKQILPDLMKVFSSTGDRPVIRTYEGKDGLTSMRNEVIQFSGEEMHIAASLDDLYRVFTKEELMQFSNDRAKKKIKSYILYNKDGDDAIAVPPQELRRLDKNDFPFSSDVYIYGNSVSFAGTKGNIFAVTIDNKEVADTMRALFRLAWAKAK